jgi:hypothetical protein
MATADDLEWQGLLLTSASAGPYTMDYPGEFQAAPMMVADGLATVSGEVLTLTQEGLEQAQELAR